MKIVFLISSLSLSLIGCKVSQTSVPTSVNTNATNDDELFTSAWPEVKTEREMENNQRKSAYVYGKIVHEKFVNKGGKKTGTIETLLEFGDGKTVHIRNKGTNVYDFNKLDKKNVKLATFIFYGLIDTDNPEQQSRMGYRLDFTELTVID